MNRNKIQLFDKMENCCGCGTCELVCHKKAISMTPGKLGCLYPTINEELCVGCGLCKSVCAYQGETHSNEKNIAVFAAMAENHELLSKSASGGVFAVIASNFLNNNGVVYGCSMEYEEQKLVPRHIRVDRKDELYKLQGSKYVQSLLGDVFQNIRQDLQERKFVLFSGTPCQVDALNKYLEKEDKSLLYTIDIICHGVPSLQMFGEYIETIEKKKHGKITEFYFRDKTWGWGLNAKYIWENETGKKNRENISADISSYYSLFLESEIYRDSCYSCKYAGGPRVGDITIGDFWCVEKEHPEYMVENGGTLSNTNGISCVLVNTEQGENMLSRYSTGLICEKSQAVKVSKWNRQLKQPSGFSDKRKKVIKAYENKGYQGVERVYRNSLGVKYFVKLMRNRRRECKKNKEANIS